MFGLSTWLYLESGTRTVSDRVLNVVSYRDCDYEPPELRSNGETTSPRGEQCRSTAQRVAVGSTAAHPTGPGSRLCATNYWREVGIERDVMSSVFACSCKAAMARQTTFRTPQTDWFVRNCTAWKALYPLPRTNKSRMFADANSDVGYPPMPDFRH
jgi:hypothetical protein